MPSGTILIRAPILIAGVAVAPRNRPFNSCKIEDNEGLRPYLRPSVSPPSSFFSLSFRFGLSLLLSPSFASRWRLTPAPRSRVQEAIVTPKRHQSPPRRFNSATRERAGSCTPRTTFFFPALLFFSSPFPPAPPPPRCRRLFYISLHERRKKGADGARARAREKKRRSDEISRKAAIVVRRIHSCSANFFRHYWRAAPLVSLLRVLSSPSPLIDYCYRVLLFLSLRNNSRFLFY